MTYDIAIIGGGVVGTAIARELSRYELKTILVEARPELGDEASKGNSALMCSGVDVPAGTLERRLVRRGYARYCAEAPAMGLPIRKVGAIVLAWNEEQEATLNKDLADAQGGVLCGGSARQRRGLSPLAAFRSRHPLRPVAAGRGDRRSVLDAPCLRAGRARERGRDPPLLARAAR